jgi:N12 class adenine-specific DNA methylase
LYNDIFITDPLYGDAVKYEEVLDFFIAWIRKNPPPEFADWIWDSRRSIAIQGEGEDFRRKMVAAYKHMTEYMPDKGIQVIMFTHQSRSIWAIWQTSFGHPVYMSPPPGMSSPKPIVPSAKAATSKARYNLLRFMLEIAPRTKNLLLGTATPIQTQVSELWDLLRILNAGEEFVLGRELFGFWSQWDLA